MDKKIKVLCVPSDTGGCGLHRSLVPHLKLDELYSNEFDVTIEYKPDWRDLNFIGSFDIIHFHKGLFQDLEGFHLALEYCKQNNIVTIMDIDDYWNVGQFHPHFHLNKMNNSPQLTQDNLKRADYVTTTTEHFAKKLRKFNPNVKVFVNALDPQQMQDMKVEKPNNGKIRIGFVMGSSHEHDMELVRGLSNRLPKDVLDKIQFVLCGYDLRGTMTERRPNGEVFTRPIRPEESVWFTFERNITNDYKIVSPQYRDFLLRFMPNMEYPMVDNEPYRRCWTKDVANYKYMEHYNEIDILLVPLQDNEFNCCKCIVGDSLVSTNKGIQYIKDIVEQELECDVEINGNYKKVVNYYKYPNKKTIKIITKNGYEIEGTPHHRIMINNKWVQLSDLHIGDTIELTKPEFKQTEYQKFVYPMLLTKNNTKRIENSVEEMLPHITINEEWGRLLGYILGDGHLSDSGCKITCDMRYDDVVADVKYLFNAIGLNASEYTKKPDKRCKTSVVKEGFGVDVCTTSATFAAIAKKYNLFGKNGKTFRVPNVILQSPKSVIKQFLIGLFEADGCITNGVSFTTKDEKLAKQVQYLLLGFGITSAISYVYNKQYRKYYYVVRLRKEESKIFLKEIGFFSKIKNEKLINYCYRKNSNHCYDITFSDEIVSVTSSINDVYDIEVEDVHMYNANGITNHNSELKFVEAGMMNVAVVASNCGPYTIGSTNFFEKGGKNA